VARSYATETVRYDARMSDTKTDVRFEAEQHRQRAEAAEEATLWRDAIREYEECLSLATAAPDGAGQDQAGLLTALGRCYWNISEARTGWRTLRRAISLYQERGDGVGQAEATLEILRIWGPPERHRMMTEDAIRALGDAEPYLRARLLLDLGWGDETSGHREEALSLAERHGYKDVLASRIQQRAWQAMEDGRVDDSVALFEEAHQAYARLGVHHPASGTLRGAGFNVIEAGYLDRGFELARRAFEYASNVHLDFQSQLALMDMAAIPYARGKFDRCEELLGQAPSKSDFRGDLLHMWMAEERGDVDRALGLMVDPVRGGRTPTADGQIHAAAAGLLFRAGREDAAKQALQTWAAVERADAEPYWMEAPALLECLLALGDEALLRKVYDAFGTMDKRGTPARFSTLQGRSFAPARAGVCARLGLLEEAERHYREGLAWCEQERCVRDAELCRAGLAEVRTRRGAPA